MGSKKTWRGPVAVVVTALWMAVGPAVTAAGADDCGDLARQVGHGGILWTQNAIVVQGTAAPHLSNPNTPLSVIKRMTQSAATLDAYRKAAGILTGIRVSSHAIAADNPRVVTGIKAFVQRARVCKAKYYADGGVDMVVMVPLSGAFAMEQLSKAGTRAGGQASQYTGLLVDARHLGFAPAIAPRLLAPDGTVLFDATVVRAEVIRGRGAARYLNPTDPLPGDLLGSRPLHTKALALGDGSPSDLVLDSTSAAALAGAPDFFGDGRVAIVVAAPVALDCRGMADAVADRHVDWETKLVLARGYGRVDFARDEDVSVRMRKMERAAEIDAQRKLLETFLAVRIDGRQTVKGLPAVAERAQGGILNAVRCGAKYFKDGSAEVVMAAPLDAMAALSLSLGRTELPPERPRDRAVNDGPTGLIVDASGQGFEPVLGPRIRSHDGRELYGAGVVSRAYVLHYGVAGYCATLSEAYRDDRVGARPLTVRGVRGTPMPPGELRLDAQATRALEDLGVGSSVLSQGRVIIVTENAGRLAPAAAGGTSAAMSTAPTVGVMAPAGQGSRVKVGKIDIP